MIPPAISRAIEPQRRLISAAVVAVGALLVLIAWRAAPLGNLHTGDTDNLVHGSRVIRHCIQNGTFHNCGLVAKDVTTVGPYPLLQYIPALALTSLGASDNTAIHLLGRLNFLAFVVMLIIVVVTSRRKELRPQVGRYALVVMLASPLWFYTTTGFGEMLSTCLFVALVAAVYCRRYWWVLVLAIAVGISKETMPYFALGLGVLVAWPRSAPKKQSLRVIGSLAVGSIIAVAINFGFNEFRYGQTGNGNYLSPLLRVPDTKTGVKQFLIILFSPNAGVLPFWPLLVLPAVLVVLALVRMVRSRQWIEAIRWLGIGALPLAFFAGLAIWYSPFGWITWGPRLEIPILPASIVAAFWMAPDDVMSTVTRWLNHRWWSTGLAVVFVSAIATFGVAAPWTHGAAVGRLIEGDSSCGPLTEVIIQKGVSEYYRCTSHDAWRRPGTVVRATIDPPSAGALLAQLLCVIACDALLFDIWRTARRGPAPNGERLPLNESAAVSA